MKIGMNLLLWTAHVTEEYFPLFAKLKQAGYDGVEVPLFVGDAAHYKRVRQELDRNGLAVYGAGDHGRLQPHQRRPGHAAGGHRPYQVGHRHDGGPGWRQPVRSLSLAARRTSPAPRHDRRGEAARRSTCCARPPSRPGRTRSCSPSKYLNRFECYFLTTAAEAAALVQAVNHPHFRMMYDTFHANIEEKHAGPAIEAIAGPFRSRPHQRERPRHARHRPRRTGTRRSRRCARSGTTAGWSSSRLAGPCRTWPRRPRSGAICSRRRRRCTRRGCSFIKEKWAAAK